MKPAFYDTDCLSCFIAIDDTSLLEEQFECIYLPFEVYDEFDRPHIQNLKNRVDNLIDKGFVKIVKFDTDTEDYLLFLKVGEAAVIAHAKKHNGIVASNNTKDVMPYVEKYNLERISTGDILEMALEKGLITEKEGNIIWSRMLKRGRWLVEKDFTSYLQKNK